MAELIIPALTTQGLIVLSLGIWIPLHIGTGVFTGSNYSFTISTGTLATFWAILAGLIHYPTLLIVPVLYIALISIISACVIKVIDCKRQKRWASYQ